MILTSWLQFDVLLFQWYDGDWSYYLDGGQTVQKQGLICTFKRNFEEYKMGQNGSKTPKRGILVIQNVILVKSIAAAAMAAGRDLKKNA